MCRFRMTWSEMLKAACWFVLYAINPGVAVALDPAFDDEDDE